MSRLLFWVPNSLMGLAVAVIGLGLIIGVIRPRRAWSLLGLILLLLFTRPIIGALINSLLGAVPIWMVAVAIPFALLALARGTLRLLIGKRAFDHMVGTLAASGILWGIRKCSRALSFPFRAAARRW